jgi:hypothetical protein
MTRRIIITQQTPKDEPNNAHASENVENGLPASWNVLQYHTAE